MLDSVKNLIELNFTSAKKNKSGEL